MIAKVDLELDRDRFPAALDGRAMWLRQGRRELEARREQDPWPVPRSRPQRLLEARRRMDEELAFEHAANRAYEHYRATGRRSDGRRFGKPAKPYSPPLVPEGRINVTDPDSREMRTQGQPNIQGDNAQAVVTERQIIVAAEITTQSPDFGQLEPMVSAAVRELENAGIDQRPRTVLADAGYWHRNQIEHLLADGFQVLVPPDSTVSAGPRPGWEGGMYSFMRRVLNRPRPRALPQTTTQHRAGVRADQAQPWDDPSPTKRQGRGAVRVAPDRSHTQPVKASQPLDRARHRVTGRFAPAVPRHRHSPSDLCPTASDKTSSRLLAARLSKRSSAATTDERPAPRSSATADLLRGADPESALRSERRSSAGRPDAP